MLRPVLQHYIPKKYTYNIFTYIKQMNPARKIVKDILHGPYFELADIFEKKM